VRRIAAVLVVLLLFPATASAFHVDPHLVPQPKLRYFVALPDWKKPFDRAVRDLNRAHAGVRLVKAHIPEQASIQVGRLEHRCGLPGVDGTTHTLSGGYAAIYLPRGCHGTIATIIAAHELGHAVGLRHDDRHCALMNSSGTGPNGIPSHCLSRRFDWLRHPYRKDDIAGLRHAFHNTRPRASLRLVDVSGRDARFKIRVSDRERNLSEVRLDFGDGSHADGYKPGDLPRTHSYSRAGSYTARLTVVDFYGRRARSSVRVDVVAAPGSP
jgi:hypothetical protein